MILIIAAVIGLIGAAFFYYKKKKKGAEGVEDSRTIITKTTPSGEAAGLMRKLA